MRDLGWDHGQGGARRADKVDVCGEQRGDLVGAALPVDGDDEVLFAQAVVPALRLGAHAPT